MKLFTPEFWSRTDELINEQTHEFPGQRIIYKQIAAQLIADYNITTHSATGLANSIHKKYTRTDLVKDGGTRPKKQPAGKVVHTHNAYQPAANPRIEDVNPESIEYQHPGLAAFCEENGVPVDKVSSYWMKGSHFSVLAKAGGEPTGELFNVIDNIVANYTNKPVVKIDSSRPSSAKALKLNIADAHVGMNPNKYGDSLFGYKYDADIFNNNLDEVYREAVGEFNTHGRFETVMLLDYGDGLDGFKAQTTRGGHPLDQSMGDLESFETYVQGKLRLIENLIKSGIGNSYQIISIGNDNHAGSFGQIANRTIEMILSRTYAKESVSCRTLKRFIEHFSFGEHIFCVGHGKDDRHMKNGLPPKLNDKTYKFICSYLDYYKINQKYIHFEKGDSHVLGFEQTKRFSFRSYMSFAPPSSWCQANFGDNSVSGFSVQVIPKYSSRIIHKDVFFEFESVFGEFDNH